jgi:hypothetical protein
MSQNAFIHSRRAKIIKRTLGLRFAAGFLRNKGVPVEEAVAILLRGAGSNE